MNSPEDMDYMEVYMEEKENFLIHMLGGPFGVSCVLIMLVSYSIESILLQHF